MWAKKCLVSNIKNILGNNCPSGSQTVASVLLGVPEMLSRSTTARSTAQAVCCRPLTAEARVRARVIPCRFFGARSGTGTGFSQISSVFSVHYIPPWLSIRIFNVGDEQQSLRWLLFRDIVLPHRHEQGNEIGKDTVTHK
jgi:hypothetical protein